MTASNNINLSVRNEFSITPGPRYAHEGKFSGEVFRKEHILPRLLDAITKKVMLIVDLDGTAGYGTSFLEESFGGLIRNDSISYEQIKKHISLISNEQEFLLDDIEDYMLSAKAQSEIPNKGKS